MPKTTFRLRVAAILKVDGSEAEQSEWSEVSNITTRDYLNFDLSHVATMINK